MDYRPYRQTNHALCDLHHDIQCNLARYAHPKDLVVSFKQTEFAPLILANGRQIFLFQSCLHIEMISSFSCSLNRKNLLSDGATSFLNE